MVLAGVVVLAWDGKVLKYNNIHYLTVLPLFSLMSNRSSDAISKINIFEFPSALVILFQNYITKLFTKKNKPVRNFRNTCMRRDKMLYSLT